MAQAPGHTFGQILGNVLEAAIEPHLKEIARQTKTYLDRKGPRKARSGVKVAWQDRNGNKHDLDFVFERGGTSDQRGLPVAFIEAAWRKYTKHSRNKVQEIQGALVPLAQTYYHLGPFTGAILAGDFTKGALDQLRSLGFHVLHVPTDQVRRAFAASGIDVEYDENTPDEEIELKIQRWSRLSGVKKQAIAARFFKGSGRELGEFLKQLKGSINRRVEHVRILSLHGVSHEVKSIGKAIEYLEAYDETGLDLEFIKYEIDIRFNNTDTIIATFENRLLAVAFLKGYIPPLALKKKSRKRGD